MATKEIRKLMRAAEKDGWRFDFSKRHIVGKHSDGIRRVTISQSPSDVHAVRNIKKDLGV